MKVKYFKLFSMVSSFILLVGAFQIKPACAGMFHQPKVPKYLTEKK
jgi:hypothetical protein